MFHLDPLNGLGDVIKRYVYKQADSYIPPNFELFINDKKIQSIGNLRLRFPRNIFFILFADSDICVYILLIFHRTKTGLQYVKFKPLLILPGLFLQWIGPSMEFCQV